MKTFASLAKFLLYLHKVFSWGEKSFSLIPIFNFNVGQMDCQRVERLGYSSFINYGSYERPLFQFDPAKIWKKLEKNCSNKKFIAET